MWSTVPPEEELVSYWTGLVLRPRVKTHLSWKLLKTHTHTHTEMIKTYKGVNRSGSVSYFTLRLQSCVYKVKQGTRLKKKYPSWLVISSPYLQGRGQKAPMKTTIKSMDDDEDHGWWLLLLLYIKLFSDTWSKDKLANSATSQCVAFLWHYQQYH